MSAAAPAGTPTGVDQWVQSFSANSTDQASLYKIMAQIFGGIQNVPTYIDAAGQPQMATWAQSLLTDEWDAQKEGDWYGNTLAGFVLPHNVGTADWMQALGFAEKWAALTGFHWMPTANMILSVYNNHITDQQQASDYFWSQMPSNVQAQYQSARVGMTQTEYQTALGTYLDSLQTLTGSRNAQFGVDPTLALHDHWSTTRFEQSIRSAYQGQTAYAYLNPQYGSFNYNSWQQHKLDSKQQVEARFGNVNDASYISDLANPLTAFSASGGTIQQIQTGKGTLADYGQSAVR